MLGSQKSYEAMVSFCEAAMLRKEVAKVAESIRERVGAGLRSPVTLTAARRMTPKNRNTDCLAAEKGKTDNNNNHLVLN